MSSELRVLGLAEVAEFLHVSKRTATRYAARTDFPKPAAQLAMGPIWMEEDVDDWVRKTSIRRGRPAGVTRS